MEVQLNSNILNTYKNIQEIFNAFNKLKVLIVGDVMLDSYLWGKVDRISPEAPVPVVSVSKRENRLGGAANVAINIKSLGATPVLCAVTGDDSYGKEFLRLLKEQDLFSEGMVSSSERVTTVKTRVIGNNHQLLRVDDEMMHPLSDKEEAALLKKIKSILDSQQIDVIIFEDYDKGVLSPGVISHIVEMATVKSIPTAVDPKRRNFTAYKNVTLFKPNLHELKTGLKIDIDKTDAQEINNAVSPFCKSNQIQTMMVTLSEAGVFYSSNGEYGIIPAHVRNISDVSGAGDTVISVAALCLALGLSPTMMSSLANLAGGLVCEKVGVVPVDKDQLLQEAASLII